MQDMQPDNQLGQDFDGGGDREGAMAKADLFKLANYSLKLFKQIQDEDQLEAWVQAKITKAADYIASVYHYLEYEMKFSEYGEKLNDAEVYSESQKLAIRNKLMEAKEKVKELKKAQAEKVKGKKEKKIDEEKSSTGGEIDRSKKGVTKHTQNPDRFSDEPHTEPKSQAKSRSAADKKGDAAADKAEEKEGKNWEKRFGKGSVTRVKDGKKVDEALKGDQKKLDVDGDKKIEKSDLAALRAKKKVKEDSHQAKTTMKHVDASDASDKEKAAIKKASKDIKPGVKGYKDRADALKAAGVKGGPMDEAKKAKQDYDKDGKIETGAEEHAGAVDNAIKANKAKKVKEGQPAQIPQNPDGATAPPPKDPKTGRYPKVTSGPNKGKEWSDKTPGPTNPAMKESVIAESAELARMKEFLTRLNG